jgi:hypothetical protein
MRSASRRIGTTRPRGLDEERHEAQARAVLLLEALLVLLAHLDHRRHVHFVERGEDRGGRLRLHQALGDALAQARHRHALVGAGAGGQLNRRARRFRLRGLAGAGHIALGDTAVAP